MDGSLNGGGQARSRILRVEPLLTTRSLRGPFDYLLPEEWEGVGVGSILQVPFGRQRLLGVVVDVAAESELPEERLAKPLAVMDDSVPPELVELGLRIGEEYASTPARGLELVLPPGTSLARGGTRPKMATVARITPAGIDALEAGERFGVKQRIGLEALSNTELADNGWFPAGGLADQFEVSRATLKSLAQRDLVELAEVPVHRAPEIRSVGAEAGEITLTSDQQVAVSAIVESLDGESHSFLLHGVTGSGKTEVYLAAAAAALERGRGVIALVPEIGLTPQTVSRFRERLGPTVAVLHSGLSDGERADEWRRLRSGEARVAVGPRSAVFAPVAGLGLVIVDEEHDSSYKQESDPRYDAREVAAWRAEAAGATTVSGSATPRPESWLLPSRLHLAERIGASMPRIEILDMRRGEDGRGPTGALHPRSREALADLAVTGGKAIVMVPRRGWTLHLACATCGHTWQCPNCEVSLVHHRSAGALRCHHCGHREVVPEACPDCGSVSIGQHGAGSEKLEADVIELVDPLPVFRLDADSARRKGAHAEILGAFDDADAGVLIGTQMVAKGHDFPDVVLSVIVDADSALRFPDFRAEERTFAQITQIAGRSGRGERGGRVLVQTLTPEAEAVDRAAAYDTAGFLEAEMARRQALAYPPAGELVRLELTAEDPEVTAKAGEIAAETLGQLLPANNTLLGPAPRFRRRNRYRRHILIKSPDRDLTVAAVREAVATLVADRNFRDVSISVDVNPQ